MSAEVRSGILTEENLRGEVDHIRDYLLARGFEDIVVMYGLACNLEMDDLYQERPLKTDALPEFVRASQQKGVFILGECDLHVDSTDMTVRFTLYHESDVHFEGSPEEAGTLRDRWQALGYAPHFVQDGSEA
ncbi:MAG: hypothetical protein ACREOU_09305 [Candidatus Eiseniibacteriota bacterium]